uniref:Soft n=1 Tax=Ganoderma boninense TaxID=34458 RepID=A0A5K1JWP3_9APHY|nr:Soft [Ganoderma boninense]
MADVFVHDIPSIINCDVREAAKENIQPPAAPRRALLPSLPSSPPQMPKDMIRFVSWTVDNYTPVHCGESSPRELLEEATPVLWEARIEDSPIGAPERIAQSSFISTSFTTRSKSSRVPSISEHVFSAPAPPRPDGRMSAFIGPFGDAENVPNRTTNPDTVARAWHAQVAHQGEHGKGRVQRVLVDVPAACATTEGEVANGEQELHPHRPGRGLACPRSSQGHQDSEEEVDCIRDEDAAVSAEATVYPWNVSQT